MPVGHGFSGMTNKQNSACSRRLICVQCLDGRICSAACQQLLKPAHASYFKNQEDEKKDGRNVEKLELILSQMAQKPVLRG